MYFEMKIGILISALYKFYFIYFDEPSGLVKILSDTTPQNVLEVIYYPNTVIYLRF